MQNFFNLLAVLKLIYKFAFDLLVGAIPRTYCLS